VKYHFFHIPALDPGTQAEALNAFIAQHRVVQVQRELVSDGAASFWALCASGAKGRVSLFPECKKALVGAQGWKPRPHRTLPGFLPNGLSLSLIFCIER
jgi:hypothetical protein